jgi:hypothetical protein
VELIGGTADVGAPAAIVQVLVPGSKDWLRARVRFPMSAQLHGSGQGTRGGATGGPVLTATLLKVTALNCASLSDVAASPANRVEPRFRLTVEPAMGVQL